jgi:hypothetical protein
MIEYTVNNKENNQKEEKYQLITKYTANNSFSTYSHTKRLARTHTETRTYSITKKKKSTKTHTETQKAKKKHPRCFGKKN